MNGSQLKRLTLRGQTDILADLADAVTEHHPDPGDPILAAQKALRRSSPALFSLTPNCDVIYYWHHPEFASQVSFDDTGVHTEASDIFATGDGTVTAVQQREYAWVHPNHEAVVEDSKPPEPQITDAAARILDT